MGRVAGFERLDGFVMYIDFEQLAPADIYFTMTQTIVPRPIAWVLSENEDQGLNLAPFSYFNAVNSQPPLISLSVGSKADGSPKDTRANILQRQHFVVHIAHTEMLEALNTSAAVLPRNVSEVEALGLQTAEFAGFPLPRLADCHIAFGCEFHSEVPLGKNHYSLILGKIKQLYLSDEVAQINAKGRLQVDAQRLQPVSRLGAGEYARFGETISLKSPR